jgi:hypothetical protein
LYLDRRMAIRQKIALKGRDIGTRIRPIEISAPQDQDPYVHKPLVLNALLRKSIAGTQGAFHTWNEVTPGFGVFHNSQSKV